MRTACPLLLLILAGCTDPAANAYKLKMKAVAEQGRAAANLIADPAQVLQCREQYLKLKESFAGLPVPPETLRPIHDRAEGAIEDLYYAVKEVERYASYRRMKDHEADAAKSKTLGAEKARNAGREFESILRDL